MTTASRPVQERSQRQRPNPAQSSHAASAGPLSWLRKEIAPGHNHCAECARSVSAERMVEIARTGRKSSRAPEARAKQGEKQRQHSKARSTWTISSHPAWLTEEVYEQKIQPLLAPMTNKAVASVIGVSKAFAGRICWGYHPYPRHWQTLAR